MKEEMEKKDTTIDGRLWFLGNVPQKVIVAFAVGNRQKYLVHKTGSMFYEDFRIHAASYVSTCQTTLPWGRFMTPPGIPFKVDEFAEAAVHAFFEGHVKIASLGVSRTSDDNLVVLVELENESHVLSELKDSWSWQCTETK